VSGPAAFLGAFAHASLQTRVVTAVVLAATLLVIVLGLPSWATVVVLTALVGQ